MEPNELELNLPGGPTFKLPNAPGLTFIIGPNGVGKSYAFRELAGRHAQHILYVPSNREVARQNLSHVARGQEETYSSSWYASEHLSRYWSRAIRIAPLRSLALSLLERLGLPQRVVVEQAGGQIQFRGVDGGQEYQANAEASGILNLATLGIGVYDPSRPTVILDEPENSLHPQAQHILLQVLREVSEKQDKHFVVITHSASMIDVRSSEDLARLVFVRRPNPGAALRRVDRLPPADLPYYGDVVPGLNTYKREAFFAENVLLVEGQTDRDFVRSVLEAGGFGPSLGRTTVLAVQGFGDQAKYYAFFRSVGVRPVSVADRDVVYPTSAWRFNPGLLPNGNLDWKGWVAPTATLAALTTPPGNGGPPVPDFGLFVQLNSTVRDLRRAITEAILDIRAQAQGLAGIGSLAGVLAELVAGRVIAPPTCAALMEASIRGNDWGATAVAHRLQRVKDLWAQCKSEAAALDILIIEKGSIEDLYRHAGRKLLDDHRTRGGYSNPPKNEACRLECADIRVKYAANAKGVSQDYPDLLEALKAKGLIWNHRPGIPHEAAAAVYGKVTELTQLIFGDGVAGDQLKRAQAQNRLDELSPNTKVITDGTTQPQPFVELEAPLLKGFFSKDGRIVLPRDSAVTTYNRLKNGPDEHP